MNFFDKLLAAIEHNQSLLYVALEPDPDRHPFPSENDSEHSDHPNNLIQQWREWLKIVINQTSDCVCAYKLSLGFYQALGIAGLELLQETLQFIPQQIPIILDAKHSDLNTSTVFARLVFETWQFDACTISPYAGLDQVAPFLVYPDKAVFILAATANSSASTLQEYPSSEKPLYLELVNACQTWGTPDQLGLEVGMIPDMLARIRHIAPERFLVSLPPLFSLVTDSTGDW